MIGTVRELKARVTEAAFHPALANPQALVSAQTIIATLTLATLSSFAMRLFQAPISGLLVWSHALIGVLYTGAAIYFRTSLNYKITTRVCSVCTIVVLQSLIGH